MYTPLVDAVAKNTEYFSQKPGTRNFQWNKYYLAYGKNGWSVVSLNLIQRVFRRFLQAYFATHRACIEKKFARDFVSIAPNSSAEYKALESLSIVFKNSVSEKKIQYEKNTAESIKKDIENNGSFAGLENDIKRSDEFPEIRNALVQNLDRFEWILKSRLKDVLASDGLKKMGKDIESGLRFYVEHLIENEPSKILEKALEWAKDMNDPDFSLLKMAYLIKSDDTAICAAKSLQDKVVVSRKVQLDLLKDSYVSLDTIKEFYEKHKPSQDFKIVKRDPLGIHQCLYQHIKNHYESAKDFPVALYKNPFVFQDIVAKSITENVGEARKCFSEFGFWVGDKAKFIREVLKSCVKDKDISSFTTLAQKYGNAAVVKNFDVMTKEFVDEVENKDHLWHGFVKSMWLLQDSNLSTENMRTAIAEIKFPVLAEVFPSQFYKQITNVLRDADSNEFEKHARNLSQIPVYAEKFLKCLLEDEGHFDLYKKCIQAMISPGNNQSYWEAPIKSLGYLSDSQLNSIKLDQKVLAQFAYFQNNDMMKIPEKITYSEFVLYFSLTRKDNLAGFIYHCLQKEAHFEWIRKIVDDRNVPMQEVFEKCMKEANFDTLAKILQYYFIQFLAQKENIHHLNLGEFSSSESAKNKENVILFSSVIKLLKDKMSVKEFLKERSLIEMKVDPSMYRNVCISLFINLPVEKQNELIEHENQHQLRSYVKVIVSQSSYVRGSYPRLQNEMIRMHGQDIPMDVANYLMKGMMPQITKNTGLDFKVYEKKFSDEAIENLFNAFWRKTASYYAIPNAISNSTFSPLIDIPRPLYFIAVKALEDCDEISQLNKEKIKNCLKEQLPYAL